MNGVTGRMGRRQHLLRSIIAIREQGGVSLADGSTVNVDPLLVGRDAARLANLAREHGIERCTTSLEEGLAVQRPAIYFDGQVTAAREDAVARAIAAGLHVYVEKPSASTLEGALRLAALAREAGVANGVVHDKLFLPGTLKLRSLLERGFFGDVTSLRGEFGYWVFDGSVEPAQRPSWNYRGEAGGGIVTDMFPHWSYLIEGLIAPITSVYAHTATHIPRRVDEHGSPYAVSAEDAAYAIFELDGGAVAQMNSSWAVRPYGRELLALTVDGTEGSAVAGLHDCRAQHWAATPRASWDPDAATAGDTHAGWSEVKLAGAYENAFKLQWEDFIRHVCDGSPWPYDLLAGARGVELAELALRSACEGRRVAVPAIAR